MHVGMPIEEAPRALDARHGTGDSRPCARSGLQQLLERLVGQAGEPGEPLAAPEERPQPPGKGDDHVAVGHRFKDLLRDEPAEGRLALRVTGGAEAALLTRERKQVLVPAMGAADAGEAMSQNPTALKALQGAGNHSPEGTEPRGVAVVVHAEEGVRMLGDQLPERRGLGFTGAIDGPVLGGSRGVRRLARYDSEGAGHRRTPPIGHAESREAIVLPHKVPSVSG